MFHTEPLLAAVLADRQREIERIGRMRRLLEAIDEPVAKSDHAAASADAVTGRSAGTSAIGGRTAGSNGSACEAL